jgi:iron complex transport system substrate-binding protein
MEHKMKHKFLKVIPILLIAIILIASLNGCNKTPAGPQTITDMYGTQLTVPGEINRVIATGPVETQLLYMIAPDKLVGLSSAWNGDPSYIPDKYKDIPVIGNSSSGSFNFEAAIAVAPDIVFEGKTKNLATDREKFGNIPVVGVNAGADLLTMYENEITYIANLLGVPERGEALLAYYHDAMNYVNGITAALSDAQKVRVYYAEGSDGLQTDALGSWHTNLLAYCGGINVADVQVSNTSQAVQVSMEQVYAWNDADPIDMIIIGRSSQATTYHLIKDSSQWQLLNCVKQGKEYVRPDNPTSWFDGPPGYGQILGMYWMVHLLYPSQTASLNLQDKVKQFYSEFLHYDLFDEAVTALLANPS